MSGRLYRRCPGANPGIAETADLGLVLEQAQQREMVSSALAGLAPGDREIVELNLRREFYGAGLADVLGVPQNQAHAATSRVRTEITDRAGPFTRAGFPMPLDPVTSRRRPVAFVPAAGVLVAAFAVFGGGAMLAASSLHHPPTPASSESAPAVPSARAAPAVSTPQPAASRSGPKNTPGTHGAGASASGTGSTSPGAKKSGKSSKPASHAPSGAPSKSSHTPAPPATSPAPPRAPSASSSSDSPTDTPTNSPMPSSASQASGILGTIIGWL